MKPFGNALTLIALAASLCGAGESHLRRNTLSVHPLMSLAVQGGALSWEHVIGEGDWSAELPLFLGLQIPGSIGIQAINLGAGLGARRYLEGGGKGWYLAPKLEVIDFNQFGAEAFAPKQRNLWVISTARAGYKWEFGNLILDGSLGGGYLKDIYLKGNHNVYDLVEPGWTPILSVTAGWAF